MNKENFYKIENIKFRLPQSYYECFTTQLAFICYYYYREYWKLFLDQEIIYNPANNENVLSFNSHILDSIYNYYGISLISVSFNDFIDNIDISTNLYLVTYRMYLYPPSKHLQIEDHDIQHAFIVYGKKDDKIFIYDAFYGLTKYEMKLDMFLKGVKQIDFLSIAKNKHDISNQHLDQKINKYIQSLDTYLLSEIYTNFLKSNYSEKVLMNIKEIAMLKEKNSLIINCIAERMNSEPLKICASIISIVIKEWNSLWYNLMKDEIRYYRIPEDIFNNTIEIIPTILENEQILYDEMKSLLCKNSIYDELVAKSLEYLSLTEMIDFNIYSEFNGVTIIQFIVFIEDNFQLSINYTELLEIKSFSKLLLELYKRILLSKIQKT